MFSVRLIGDRAVIGQLDTMSERLRVALRQTVTRLAMLLLAKVQQEKLQGQVLRHISGKLSRSIEQIVTENPTSVIGRVFSNGTAPYAAIHEFGFDGMETVRQHTRTMVFGRAVDPFSVGPFERHMTMPERSFLRKTLVENAAMIERELTNTVVRVVSEGIV